MAATATATADSSLFSAPMQMSFLAMPQMVTVQFDALRVADFSPKKFTVLNPALHSSPSHLRNKARMRNF